MLQHFELAAKHVVESEKIVRKQRALVAQLELDGAAGQGLLREFEHSLELHRYELERIRVELGMAQSLPK